MYSYKPRENSDGFKKIHPNQTLGIPNTQKTISLNLIAKLIVIRLDGCSNIQRKWVEAINSDGRY